MTIEPSPDAEAQAIAALRRGEAVVLPTDTVYGVAAVPTILGATDALFRLKERGDDRPLAVLVADAAQALALIDDARPGIRRVLAACWPGPVTVVVRRAPAAAGLALGGDPTTIGLRCPDHALVRAIARAVGPIATTSANRHGQPTPTTAAEAAAALAHPVAVVVDGGVLDGLASTVVDLSGFVPVVLRQGAVDAAVVERAWTG